MMTDITTPSRPYQRLGQYLEQRIYSGEFKVGDKMPPERYIAEEMQVNRSVVREAIIMLELKGLVEVKQGSGVYIINTSEPSAKTSEPTNSEADIGPFELLQARQLLESEIAALAAVNINKANISVLHDALNMEERQLKTAYGDFDGDALFHFTIAEASQNSVLHDTVQELWRKRDHSSMWKQLHHRISDTTYSQAWLEDHKKILNALQRRSPEEAKQAMWQHIENVKVTLFELSDIHDPKFDGFLFR